MASRTSPASGKPRGSADYSLEPEGGRDDAPPTAGVIEGDSIPYLPQALEQKQKNFDARLTNDPRLKCFTLGTPRGIYYPEPFQILQRSQDITVYFEFGDSVRTIHTDGTLHPVDTDNEFWLGDSRGHWEGDTLVVDVTDFSDETWLDRSGDFHQPRSTRHRALALSRCQHTRLSRDAGVPKCLAGLGRST